MAWQLPCGAAPGSAPDVILSLSTGKLILISGNVRRSGTRGSKKKSGKKEREREGFNVYTLGWMISRENKVTALFDLIPVRY